jgi:hypothetical protein
MPGGLEAWRLGGLEDGDRRWLGLEVGARRSSVVGARYRRLPVGDKGAAEAETETEAWATRGVGVVGGGSFVHFTNRLGHRMDPEHTCFMMRRMAKRHCMAVCLETDQWSAT